jgi:gamma-glutamylputrescine oxidase
LRIATSKGSISAGAAVVATNAWLPNVLPELAGLITPVRGQVLAYAPLPKVFPVPLGVSITPTGEYWQQTLDGTIVIGGCRALAADRDVDTTEVTTSLAVQTGIEQVLPSLFPELGPLEVARRWGGTMAFSSDYLPLAGQVGTLPLWYAGGFSGHGMPFAIPLGRALAQAASSGIAPAELALFNQRPTTDD